jgi:hypothetical protein
MNRSRRCIGTALGNREALPALAPHRDAKPFEQRQCDVDVGLGDQLALNFDHHVLRGCRQGQGQQQGGQELA